MEVTGKRVLLTGATGGLGQVMAHRIADAGGILVLSGRDGERLTALEGELPGEGHSTCVVDLGAPGGAEQLVREAGFVDCLVANAALPATGRLDELDPAQVARMLRINLEAPIHLTQALLPGMVERSEGKVVLIGSLSGKAGSPHSSIYNATKFGLRGFAFGLRTDLAGTGVGVTVVAPGFVREAGMFAEAGVRAPRIMGTTTPGRVADAVIEAIREDRGEITVAPPLQRLLAHIGLLSPRMAHRAQLSRTGRRTAEELARGQIHKR